MPRKPFTVDAANALIPALGRAFAQIREQRASLQHHMDKLQVLDALWGEKVTRHGNPDHAEFLEHRSAVAGVVAAIESLIQREILERGLRFPSGGLENELIDFPTTYDGRWVYLCWKSDEPRIVAWHEVDGGFGGRVPLTPEHTQVMGKAEGEVIDDSGLDV